MDIIAKVFWVVAVLILVAELGTGIAVMVGLGGDFTVFEREKAAGRYWFTIALHAFIILLPTVAMYAF